MPLFRIGNQLNIGLGLIGCALSVSLSAQAGAHVGSRVFPIAELTDEMLAEIQLGDDFLEEWFDLIGEPTLTLVDFMDQSGKSTHDPADMDFRIWLAWHGEPARLYVALVAADDSYVNTHTYDVDWIESAEDDMMRGWEGGNDGIVLGVDGDHSGSPGRDLSNPTDGERFLETSGTAQSYAAISRTPAGPTLDDWQSRYMTKAFSWMTLPPYAVAGGSVVGETPVIWSIELYVTPFDHIEDLTSSEGSVASDLSAGQIIGFGIGVYDADKGGDNSELAPEVHVMDSDRDVFWDIESMAADYFIDGLLLPEGKTEPVEDTAVESVSWGRIKASLW